MKEVVVPSNHLKIVQRFLKIFFSRDIDDPLLYDVVWNTGRVEMREISESVIQLVQHRAGRSE